MPQFLITGPDGKKYKVTGPNAEGALNALKRQLGGGGASAPSNPSGMDAEIGAMTPNVPVGPARVRAEYDALPGYIKPLVAADDLVTQFASGLTMGLAEKGVANINAWRRGTDYETERAKINKMLADSRARSGIAGTVANVAGAVIGPAKVAKAGVTATKLPVVGAPLGLVIDGGVIGGLTAFGNDQDVAQGAALGGALGGAGQLVASAGKKIISPFLTSAERASSAKVLADEGVRLTAGQKTGNRALRYAESELGGGAAENILENQAEQFTAAALRRIGVKADRATPEVMSKAGDRIGKAFDDLAARNAMIPDQKIAQDLSQIAVDYASVVAPNARLGKITNVVDDVLNLLQTGKMDGKVYKTLRSDLGAFSRRTSQPEAKEAARELIEALDAAMERSILRLNPRDAGAWSKVRRDYRNLMVLEDTLASAGENTANSLISPARLRSVVARGKNKRNYVRGKGDFTNLARAGEAVMKELPQSGTAPRAAARGAFHILGAGLGGGYGYGTDGVQGALTGAALGLGAPYAAGRMLMSRPVQSWLGNQAAGAITPEMQAALGRLFAAGGTLPLLNYQ